MAERAIYPVRFSTPKIDEDGRKYVDYTEVQGIEGPSRYGEFPGGFPPLSGRCVGAEDPITLEPYDSARPGLVLQPERGPGQCFQAEPGKIGVIRSIWNNGNPVTREELSDENKAYLKSRIAPPYPWEPFPFRMRLHFHDGSSVEIPCDENAGVRSRDETIMRNAQHIDVPRGVTTIGNAVFFRCTSVYEITLPAGVTTIGEKAFYECSFLLSITLPEGVTTIGEKAFWGCSSLVSVTFPEGVTTIEASAFELCSSLTSTPPRD